MFNYEFDVFSTKSITLKFLCSECSEEIEETIDSIPSPNLLAERDTYSGTLETDCTDIECPHCHKNYNIQLGASMYGGELYSNDLDENTEVEIEDSEAEYYEDFSEIIESNSSFFETFSNQMSTNKKLFYTSVLSEDLKSTLNNLLFSNIITCLETYLSDALINTVLNNEVYIKRFVQNFKDYKDISIKLPEIYEKMSNLTKRVKEDLFKLMYHNLPKIKNIYKMTLDIDFPNNVGEIMKEVSKRHDLVHRNGKDKEGNLILITEENLNDTYNLVFNFIKEIDKQLNENIA